MADLSRGEVRIPLLLLTTMVNELEYAGLVRHDGDEPVSGRFLRYLTLTPRGVAALERQVEAFEYKAATARAVLPPPSIRTRRGPRA